MIREGWGLLRHPRITHSTSSPRRLLGAGAQEPELDQTSLCPRGLDRGTGWCVQASTEADGEPGGAALHLAWGSEEASQGHHV